MQSSKSTRQPVCRTFLEMAVYVALAVGPKREKHRWISAQCERNRPDLCHSVVEVWWRAAMGRHFFETDLSEQKTYAYVHQPKFLTTLLKDVWQKISGQRGLAVGRTDRWCQQGRYFTVDQSCRKVMQRYGGARSVENPTSCADDSFKR